MDALNGVFADNTNPLEADADVLRQSFVLSDSAAELVVQQQQQQQQQQEEEEKDCLLYTSPSPRDRSVSRMPSSA